MLKFGIPVQFLTKETGLRKLRCADPNNCRELQSFTIKWVFNNVRIETNFDKLAY